MGSWLEVYLPKEIIAHANWRVGTSCTTTGNASSALGTFSNCLIVTNSQFTVIKLTSGAGNNYFFNNPTAPLSEPPGTTEEQYYNTYGGICDELCPFDNILVTIQDLVISTNKVSNFAENMYDIFLRLHSNATTSAITVDWVGNLIISSQQNKFSNMAMSFGQRLTPNTDSRADGSRETDKRSVYRPSWLHITSSTKSGPNVTLNTDI